MSVIFLREPQHWAEGTKFLAELKKEDKAINTILRAVSVKNGASRPRVDFVQICDCPYDLGFGEKLGKITIKIFSSHLGDHQLLRAYIGSI